MDYMGFRVDSDATLERLAGEVAASGLAQDCARIPAGEHLRTGRRFRFTIPTGHAIELFADKDKLGCQTGDLNPDPGRTTCGMAPSRFDHCLLYGDDLDGTVKLFRDVLGFSLAEEVVAGPERMVIGAFLTCSNKAHDIAFIRHPEKNRFHHASFQLDNWSEVLKAADIISSAMYRSTSVRPGTASRAAPPSTSSTPRATATRSSPAAISITRTNRPSRTDNELGRAIFYHDRKLNDAFLNVLT